MNENNKDLKNEYDSLKDVAEFQNNMFNPGHYIGTGRVMPIISAPGNALPLAITNFLLAAFSFAFGLCSFFYFDLKIVDKIILLIIMSAMSLFYLFMSLGYFRKSKKYRKQKTALHNEQIDETVNNQIWQRTCPKCGKTHDVDYPKCPNCKHSYLK